MVTVLRRILIAAGFVGFALFISYCALSGSPPLRAASPDSCQLTWHRVAPPSAGSDVQNLNSVHALASNEVWVVGQLDHTSTLIEHWNGTAWSVVTSPNAASGTSALYGVHGIAANDVWAVGTNIVATDDTHALILHWDGNAWSIVPGPTLVGAQTLRSVVAIAANDVWAVGSQTESGTGKNLALHWNGSTWQEVVTPTPNPSVMYSLLDVAAVNTNDVWAVGTSILHWDGTQWLEQSSGAPSGKAYFGIVAFNSSNVWASSDTFVRWNGAQWNAVSPGPSNFIPEFRALDGVKPKNIYAVGSTYAHGWKGVSQHYDGAQWNDISPYITDSYLNDVSAVSSAEVWAVGTFSSFLPPTIERGVILHGTAPCIVPTPIPLVKPVLLAPANNAIKQASRPVLDWRNVKNATSYRVQLGQAAGTWKTHAVVNDSQWQAPALQHNTKYVWRVRACDATHCGAWSAYFTFTVKP